MLLLRKLAQGGLLGREHARSRTTSFTELEEAWLIDLLVITSAGLVLLQLVIA